MAEVPLFPTNLHSSIYLCTLPYFRLYEDSTSLTTFRMEIRPIGHAGELNLTTTTTNPSLFLSRGLDCFHEARQSQAPSNPISLLAIGGSVQIVGFLNITTPNLGSTRAFLKNSPRSPYWSFKGFKGQGNYSLSLSLFLVIRQHQHLGSNPNPSLSSFQHPYAYKVTYTQAYNYKVCKKGVQ